MKKTCVLLLAALLTTSMAGCTIHFQTNEPKKESASAVAFGTDTTKETEKTENSVYSDSSSVSTSSSKAPEKADSVKDETTTKAKKEAEEENAPQATVTPDKNTYRKDVIEMDSDRDSGQKTEQAVNYENHNEVEEKVKQYMEQYWNLMWRTQPMFVFIEFAEYFATQMHQV